jgi:hypothetical protein
MPSDDTVKLRAAAITQGGFNTANLHSRIRAAVTDFFVGKHWPQGHFDRKNYAQLPPFHQFRFSVEFHLMSGKIRVG